MLLLIHAVCLVLAISQCFCYIFDVKYSYTYNVTRNGYLATFLQRNVDGSFKLVAGIPKEDKIIICDNGLMSCQNFASGDKSPAGYELLGAVIDGGSNANDPIYVCSPRFIVSVQYRVNGRCIMMQNGTYERINSLEDVYKQIQIFNNTPEFFYAHGQAGFSIKYIDKNEFVVGAPGVLSWKGTIIKHSDRNGKHVIYSEKIIDRNSYLGYSVEYGNFYFSGIRIQCIISGAPRDDKLIGQILKPQKTRLPLGELDLGNQDSAEQVPNLNKSTRRVSFASNNFIKPFVADPEKNTIWDLTYEESLEKSDSLQCAKANIDKKNVCESLNVTIMNDYGDEINLPQNERTMRNTSVNVILDQENKTTSDMEFTSVIDNIQNVNVDNNNSNMGLCDMELTNVVHNVQNVNYDGSNITMNLCDMEFTNPVCILNIDVHNEGDNMHISEVSMEETEMVPILIRETTQNILVGTNDMCNLAASSEKSQNISVTTQNDKTSDNNLEVSMDQTEVVPILIDVQHHDISVVSENVLRHSQSLCASYDNKKSDFSKVISGDLNPSFRNLSSMPLRGFNSTSFVESCMKDETLSKCQQNMDENGDDSSVQDANIYMFNNPTENCNTDTPLTDNTSSELKNSGSDTNLKNVGCETTIWNRVKPLDTSWINSYRERNISFKTRHHKYFKLVGHRLQEVSKIYEREIHKCGEIKEILNYLKLHKEKEDKKHNLHQEHGTWKDNILELHLRSKDYWSILSLDDDLLKFSTLYGTITFTIEVSDHDRRVLNLELENLLSEAAEPFALYVNNIFMKKLKLEPIQSALGEKFDILSLLDYVRLTMENLLTIHKDFVYLSITYAVSMDREFNIKFAIIGVNSMFSWRFIINASDYENISQESVTYNAKIGELRERDIKRCMQGCPKGFGFVKPFVENLNNFVEELEKTI